jgi:hypothetical protein
MKPPAHSGDCRPGLQWANPCLHVDVPKKRREDAPGFRSMRYGATELWGGAGVGMLCHASGPTGPGWEGSKKESPGRRAEASLPLHVPPNRLRANLTAQGSAEAWLNHGDKMAGRLNQLALSNEHSGCRPLLVMGSLPITGSPQMEPEAPVCPPVRRGFSYGLPLLA